MVNQSTKKKEVFLSLGSNIDPEENLKYACRELKKAFGNIQISSVYRNKSIGFEGNDFLNMVVKVKSTFSPSEMLNFLGRVESATGRDIGTGAFDSRTLDIDMILYNDLVHPRKAVQDSQKRYRALQFCPLPIG